MKQAEAVPRKERLPEAFNPVTGQTIRQMPRIYELSVLLCSKRSTYMRAIETVSIAAEMSLR